MSDGPHDQEPDRRDAADEPTTGPPAGAASASYLDADTTARVTPSAASSAAPASGAPSAGASSAGATPAGTGPTGGKSAGTGRGAGPATGPEAEARKRRKRRLIVGGIAVAAAVVVIALCVSGLAVLRAVSGFRDDVADAREDRRLRDSACLELETRLNRLVPPGATTTPQVRAKAVRDENAATRIYVGRLDDQRVSDGWRELLDARTSYAEALDAQVRSRTPAFYVAPAPRDGVSLADQLTLWSPAACAGPIRRLAAPDL